MNSRQWDALTQAEREYDASCAGSGVTSAAFRIAGEIWDRLSVAERWELLWYSGITGQRGPNSPAHKTGARDWDSQRVGMQRKIATVICAIDCME